MGVRRICGRTRGKYFCLVVKLQAQRRPDSEQIEPAGAKPLRRNSVSVEQIQDESLHAQITKKEVIRSLFLLSRVFSSEKLRLEYFIVRFGREQTKRRLGFQPNNSKL